ncbi:Formin-like protein 3 [Hondaea fermentalgiana]|uniref:Formin-like protein 3 n=1 Tax=Hondaea fermentalgiana TaxID=2315210 RepID=A0A2R5GVA8_9STRA|nr:Formin-like protein 3 [Hondaea fermentalgiana]|eukprot:GBG34259.1 Formin-like protein 3 [Hondaea fermentalgiana]
MTPSQLKRATSSRKASYAIVDEDSDDDEGSNRSIDAYSDEEETFMVRNLDTGEYERVTLSQMINGGVVSGINGGSFDDGEDDSQYEEVESTRDDASTAPKGQRGRFSSLASESVTGEESEAEMQLKLSSLPSISMDGLGVPAPKSGEEEGETDEIDTANAPVPETPVSDAPSSNAAPPPEAPRLSPLHRAGAMLVRSILGRRQRSRLVRAFGKWDALQLVEVETQRLAEEVSSKSEECAKLNDENTALRVKRAGEPGPQSEPNLPQLVPIRYAEVPATIPIARESLGATTQQEQVVVKLKDDPQYGKFFKMLAVRVPLQAVKNKAEAEGLDPSMLDKDPNDPSPNQPKPAVAAEAPAAAAEIAPVKLKDDPQYGKFFKMLAVRVPLQAVKNKVEAEGLDPNMLDKDPNDPSPNQPKPATSAAGETEGAATGEAAAPVKLKDDPQYGKFFKMLAVRVPLQAVKNKVEAEGLDPNMLDKDPNDPSPNQPAAKKEEEKAAAVALKDDPRYGKFFKMLAVRVPLQAVKNKVEAEGLDPAMMDKDPNDPAPPMPGAESEKGGGEKAAVALKDDPRYGKFFKMLAVRVPLQAVKNKVEAEGLDPAMMDKDPNDPAPPLPGAEGGKKKKKEKPTVALKDDPRYGKFFKMLAVRVPLQAVEAEGLDPAMMDKDPNDPAPAAADEDDDDEDDEEEEAATVALKDDPRYGKFFKMLAVRVPLQAVKNKVEAEGLDPAMMDKDPNDAAPPLEDKDGGKKKSKKKKAKMVKVKDDPRYAPFLKMLAVKVPRGAVEVKMRGKGLDPAILDLDPESLIEAEGEGDGSSKKKKGSKKKAKKAKEMVKLKDDERYAPFFKMLAVKVPRGAVEVKMRGKGLDPEMLDKDPETMIPAAGAEGGDEDSDDDDEEDGEGEVKMVKLKDDERYAPFFKMLAVKVPRGAVEVKMRGKGLDPEMLDKDPDTMIPAAGSGSGKKTASSKAAKPKAKPKPKPVEKKPDKIVRRKLHWRKVTKHALDKADDRALWTKASKFMFEQREVKELNDYFTFNMSEQERRKEREKAAKAKEEGASGAGDAGKKKKAKKEAKKQVLDPQRSNNISIVLSRMKGHGIDSKVVRRCLYTLDVPDSVSTEDVRSLLGLLPTPEEEKTLKAFEGERSELERAEAYFLDLMDIPRYKQRVNCFLYKLKFNESYEEAEIDFEVLGKACKEILESKKLRRIFEIVLALGNFLNEGESPPPARVAEGFMLDSLSKLRQVRSFQSKTTALHYMVMLIQTRQVELVSYVKSETDNVRAASNVSLTNALAQLQVLENGIKTLANEVKFVAGILEDPAKREAMTEEDQAFALGLNRFYKEASSSLEELRTNANETEESFKTVVDYFCEDASTTSETLFRMLQGFFADFELALNENDAARQKYLRVKRQKEKIEAQKQKDEAQKQKEKPKGKAAGAEGRKAKAKPKDGEEGPKSKDGNGASTSKADADASKPVAKKKDETSKTDEGSSGKKAPWRG